MLTGIIIRAPMETNRLRNERGGLTFKAAILLTIAGLLSYGGYKTFPPAYSYLMMKKEVDAEVSTAHFYTDEELTQHLMESSRNWNVPLDVEDIVIERQTYEIEVTIYYTVELLFFNKYEWLIPIEISVSEDLQKARRRV